MLTQTQLKRTSQWSVSGVNKARAARGQVEARQTCKALRNGFLMVGREHLQAPSKLQALGGL